MESESERELADLALFSQFCSKMTLMDYFYAEEKASQKISKTLEKTLDAPWRFGQKEQRSLEQLRNDRIDIRRAFLQAVDEELASGNFTFEREDLFHLREELEGQIALESYRFPHP